MLMMLIARRLTQPKVLSAFYQRQISVISLPFVRPWH
jgi:hypothetical protein